MEEHTYVEERMGNNKKTMKFLDKCTLLDISTTKTLMIISSTTCIAQQQYIHSTMCTGD